MTLDNFMLAVHVVLCLSIFWSCFCRQTHSNQHTTRPQVRAVFWLLAVAALVLGIAPWAQSLWRWPPYYPSWPELGMLAAIALVQLATAHYWRKGVPASFAPLSPMIKTRTGRAFNF